jgi:dienelactone hydrolase
MFRLRLYLLALSILFAQAVLAADPRADFLKLIDRSKVPLAAESSPVASDDGLVRTHFSFASEAAQRVPGLSVKLPATERLPVVIALHGTGGTKGDFKGLLATLARKGFLAIAIDGRYHGERTKAGHGDQEYQDAIIRAWDGSGEHPLYYDTVWDVMRLIDYLRTRDDVDASRIGLMGISKGGIETYLAAAVDPRIAVAVPCIGVQSFHWALDHDNAWKGRVGTFPRAFATAAAKAGAQPPDAKFAQRFYDRIVPGIYGEFDGPSMLPLIAPRPLFVINGDSDPSHTPLEGLQEAISAAKSAYAAADAADHFSVLLEKDTGHQVKPEAERDLVAWFVRWLKPKGSVN